MASIREATILRTPPDGRTDSIVRYTQTNPRPAVLGCGPSGGWTATVGSNNGVDPNSPISLLWEKTT